MSEHDYDCCDPVPSRMRIPRRRHSEYPARHEPASGVVVIVLVAAVFWAWVMALVHVIRAFR